MGKGKTVAPHSAEKSIEKPLATPPVDLQVIKPRPRGTHCFEIEDASKVYNAALSHFPVLFNFGLTEEDLAVLDRDLAEAITLEATGGRLSLSQLRQKAKNLAGGYRSAGGLSCSTVRGPVVGRAETLKIGGSFPAEDPVLSKYLSAIVEPMRSHTALLQKHGFGADRQDELGLVATQFAAALTAMPGEQSKLNAESEARKRAFDMLELSTRHVRKIGREAFLGVATRSQFDRAGAGAASEKTVAVHASRKLEKAQARLEKAQAEVSRLMAEVAKLEAGAKAAALRAEVSKGKKRKKK